MVIAPVIGIVFPMFDVEMGYTWILNRWLWIDYRIRLLHKLTRIYTVIESHKCIQWVSGLSTVQTNYKIVRGGI